MKLIKVTDMKTLERKAISQKQMVFQRAWNLRKVAMEKSPDGKVPSIGYYLRYTNQYFQKGE